MSIEEPDWKVFKKVRERALERFSARVLDECVNIRRDESKTEYERYIALYQLLQERDQQMAKAFDEFSRSSARISLMLMFKYDLLTADEVQQFSADVQRMLDEVRRG